LIKRKHVSVPEFHFIWQIAGLFKQMDGTRYLSNYTMDTVTTAPQNLTENQTDKPAKVVKANRGPLAKHWAGCTLNNYCEADIAAFLVNVAPIADYYVFGKELAPTTGTPHLQFMVCFKTAKRLTAVTKLLPSGGRWFVKSNGSTMLQASDYCKKEGNFTEFGTLPLDQTTAGLKKIKDNYDHTLASAKAGRIDDIEAGHQIKYYGTIKKIQADYKKMPENLNWKEGEQPNFWIYGPTSMCSFFFYYYYFVIEASPIKGKPFFSFLI